MEKPAATYKITVQASTRHLSKVRDFVARHAAKSGFSEKEVNNIRLAVDEAYTNIIKHAYKNDYEKSVDIELGYDDTEFWISLVDTGQAFDPGNYQQPDIRQKIKEKKRGGVGVYLIRELMDEVEYRTQDAINSIQMSKKK